MTAVNLEGTEAVVQTEYLSKQEVAAMFARPDARSRGGIGVSEQAIGVDNPCTSSSLTLHDETVSACIFGGCNTICFSGSGTATLANFCRTRSGFFCTSTWDQAVRSYDPNNNSGHFSGSFCGDNGCVNFSGTDWVDAPFCGGQFVTIGSSC